MTTVALPSIYDHIAKLKPRRIALITQRYNFQTKYEDGIESLEYNLRNRESAFTVQIDKMGIVYEVFTLSEPKRNIEPLKKRGAFDMIIIAGEVCSQSISIAAELKKARILQPTFLEITEDEAANPKSLRAANTTAKRMQVIEALSNFVYLTRERKSPRTAQFDVAIESASILAPEPKKKAPMFTPTALDSASPPKRIKAQVTRVIRDTETASSLKALYDYRCQICGIRIPLSEDKFYVEVHHIRPLGGRHAGPDTSDNMLVLCPNHHAMFDYFLPIFGTDASVQITGITHKLTSKHSIDQSMMDYHNIMRKPQKSDSKTGYDPG